VFPEVEALFGVPQPAKWHPEIDTGIHTMMVLEQAALLSVQPEVRFAALVHDLGKATTPQAEWPKHLGHEKRSVRLVKALSKRMPVPATFRDLGMLVAEFHAHCHRAFELRAETILKVLQQVDAFRRPDRFEQFLLACEADARGRTGFEKAPYGQADYFREACAKANAARVSDDSMRGLNGPAIGALVEKTRLDAIREFRDSNDQNPKK
jgi:tRNA nucleotidyltransferase (CCA-adding enzyme)